MNVLSRVSRAISSCSRVMSGFMDRSFSSAESRRFLEFIAFVCAISISPWTFTFAALYAPIQKMARIGTATARPTTRPAQKNTAFITVSAYTHGIISARLDIVPI